MFADMLTAMVRGPWGNLPVQAFTSAAADVSETDKEVVIAAELPGFSQNDIQVDLDEDLLTIRAERKSDGGREAGEKRDVHLVERSYGMLARSFRLPFSPDPQQIDAVLQSGVLTIRIPKPPAVQEKVSQIAIRSGEGEPTSQTAHTENAKTDRTQASRGAKGSAAGESAPH
jgi:HSP20 family protein